MTPVIKFLVKWFIRIYSPMAQRARTPLTRQRRQRNLPAMTTSERGKYYRNRNKLLEAQRETRVKFLRGEVRRMEIQLQVARHLSRLSVPPNLSNISNFLSHFITEQYAANTDVLQRGSLHLSSLNLLGPADAPVVRLEYVLRGRLHPLLVRRLYEFVVGNSFAFERMMYDEAELPCTCFFYFASDGNMERLIIEREVVGALRVILGGLRVTGDALAELQFTVR